MDEQPNNIPQHSEDSSIQKEPNASAQQSSIPEQLPNEEFEKQFELYENQQKMIREEMAAESPLIGDVFPLALLMDEFLNNENFYVKIQNLMGTYESYRKTRRDGSCFYRALAFSIFEKMVCKQDKSLQEHMLGKIKGAKEHLLKANFEGIIFEDIQDFVLEKMDKKLPKSLREVVQMFRDPDDSNYIVLLLRFLASGELRNNAILYETFVEEGIPIEMFCQLHVEPIDKEADQIPIMALLNYLEVGIRIVYLDASGSKEAFSCVLPESFPQDKIVGELLYRPGHYDLLYR